VALDVEDLHSDKNAINQENAVTERGDPVDNRRHDILTGSRPDGTAFQGSEDLTCGNWTSDGAGRAQVGHHDRNGDTQGSASWNSAHPSGGCSQENLQSTDGAGLLYCFAID
jgi:hypothetical protein